MYTVKKIEEPDRGELFAVVVGENIINRWNDEEEAKENCTFLNGGEAAEKKLAAREKKAEEDAKKAATDVEAAHKAHRDAKAKTAKADKPEATKPRAEPEDNHKPRAQPAKAKAHVRHAAPKPTRRHK